ncbi:hypothetical protein JAG48_000831 [Proteus mirabilis]|nr:hypothetical protein [Proteus mirabilis]EJD6391824.1 hypothetical protein [Proteus mirabilis]ELB1205504.1 hypothetical protein [Proteus mirabilis]
MIELQKQFQPKARNICSACGKDVGVSKLVVVGNVNICFDCSDLAKEMADEKRKGIAETEINQIANTLSTTRDGNFDVDMVQALVYANRLYKAGYRKVE